MATKKGSAASSNEAVPKPSSERSQMQRQVNMTLGPNVNAAAVMRDFGRRTFGEVDLTDLVIELNERMDHMLDGSMNMPQAMLFAQAQALQSIFTSMARRAVAQQDRQALEAYLRMGLKAQNQCRMTLETLAMIKNPPTIIARQANINNGGQQQVNNGTAREAPRAPAAIAQTQRTELLEVQDGQRLDTGPTGAASGVDPLMETVGAVHRATKS